MRATWLDGADEIPAEKLREQGLVYERLPLEPDGYQPTLDDLRDNRGYGTQDEVKLTPETENLDAICAKFAAEHLHSEDEVRFILAGEGVFDIRSVDDRWMHLVVEAGDLLVVPARRYHRFFLTDARSIHAVRLFQDPAGWTPVYRDA
jgi:1,2-dihydroxy-3-keto-5-methylthiopentene dioxygenase